jgi:membrane protein implicated in regulation of membrane protease activity
LQVEVKSGPLILIAALLVGLVVLPSLPTTFTVFLFLFAAFLSAASSVRAMLRHDAIEKPASKPGRAVISEP